MQIVLPFINEKSEAQASTFLKVTELWNTGAKIQIIELKGPFSSLLHFDLYASFILHSSHKFSSKMKHDKISNLQKI